MWATSMPSNIWRMLPYQVGFAIGAVVLSDMKGSLWRGLPGLEHQVHAHRGLADRFRRNAFSRGACFQWLDLDAQFAVRHGIDGQEEVEVGKPARGIGLDGVRAHRGPEHEARGDALPVLEQVDLEGARNSGEVESLHGNVHLTGVDRGRLRDRDRLAGLWSEAHGCAPGRRQGAVNSTISEFREAIIHRVKASVIVVLPVLRRASGLPLNPATT